MGEILTSKFRKKPVVIEAFQLTNEMVTSHLLDKAVLPFGLSIGDWSGHPERREIYRFHLYIKTLEGTMEAVPGDWLIKGVRGEIYPCKPDIFDATYDLVEEPPHAS